MADFTMKKGDTRPILEKALTTPDGLIDLSSATGVQFLARTAVGGTSIINSACVIDADPATGVISYTWAAGDTSTAYTGLLCEFEVSWADGGVQSIPNDSYYTLDILGDLS